ncbi:MAG: hypothetical protein LBR34_11630 [Prevotella sp.]|jgi:hypothetical protein|nr:hypothetical protein [Prevotella sp.]
MRPKATRARWGGAVDYVQKEWKWTTGEGTETYGAFEETSGQNGLQAGVCFEPLFKYSFGLSTGLFYEYYQSTSDTYDGNYTDGSGMIFIDRKLYIRI